METRLTIADQARLRGWVGLLLVLCGVITATLLAGFLFSSPVSAQVSGSTFTVNSTTDPGTGGCNATECTLREAITLANGRSGPNTIAFNIPDDPNVEGNEVKTIQLTKELPQLKDATGPTTIDGYTQPDSSPNTNSDSLASNASIKVEIRGIGADRTNGAFNGLTITSPQNVVRGLAFYNLDKSIRLSASGADDNHITGNFLGTNAAGTHKTPVVQWANGVHIHSGAVNNTIGGAAPAERNVISGNAGHGVGMYNDVTNNNRVVGNIIGLNPSGTARLENKRHGVDINTGASHNIIGGTSSGEGNVISGNVSEGIEISHPDLTDRSNPKYPTGNQVIGNFVGTDITGELAPEYAKNGNRGLNLQDKAKESVVRDNVFGNNRTGVVLGGFGVTGSNVYDNWIGISRGGNAIPNRDEGILFASRAADNKIGPNNIVANNPTGIVVRDPETDRNTITRNSIHDNTGLGIDIAPLLKVNPNDANDADTGPNNQLNFPVLNSATLVTVSGTACAGCTVEVFVTDNGGNTNGEGKSFVGSAEAGADGQFTVSVTGVNAGEKVTATATDVSGNTSEFSANRVVEGEVSG